MTNLIAPATASVSFGDIKFSVLRDVPRVLSATALTAAETVGIEYSGDGGASFQTATDDVGNPLQLTASIGQLLLRGTGNYRVNKTATASACGVNISE